MFSLTACRNFISLDKKIYYCHALTRIIFFFSLAGASLGIERGEAQSPATSGRAE